jgi:hypothetical protein
MMFGRSLFLLEFTFSYGCFLRINCFLTRDNLEKRQHLDDTKCLFCTERESIHQLFFDCVVARRAWELVSQAIGVQVGSDFESIAKLWLCNKKFGVVNIVTSVV